MLLNMTQHIVWKKARPEVSLTMTQPSSLLSVLFSSLSSLSFNSSLIRTEQVTVFFPIPKGCHTISLSILAAIPTSLDSAQHLFCLPSQTNEERGSLVFFSFFFFFFSFFFFFFFSFFFSFFFFSPLFFCYVCRFVG